ncbi:MULTISPECIES: aromatic ring-hydroxylating dioxygenase subunit alpha [unclassified Sphingobium]|uniref:aromatic ring-hydroxylating dioxygenase subunit alpha n=1 Tax=unclassified Sphingobium TaxID=2611147 RepID=UPI00222440FC|nr:MULTISPECIES: aromatic ring-hydroxylating dioxygenase subunit alpha [unclassified Sphingobium]MCW2394029.1 vanillate O-demethylase monooxygenase subunit [Sphingobium sp. B8D3B]MCW2417543.1 vanillate O-demethylase monooxygenase subunit [Sphingobium sp. B8D3C]
MYPFGFETLMVRNRWYIACFASEIDDGPIERTILGKPVALYRTEAGVATAMYGICPHRYYPLAKGRVRGDALVCGYHGFAFAADGKCVDIPSQGTGANFCQPVFPLLERGPFCWIWMGDGEKADPDLLPPYEDFGLDQPGWRASSFDYFRVGGRAQLLIDNLMDLTHLPYVHHHIAGGDSMARTAMREEPRPRSYRLVRQSKVPWTPFFDHLYGAGNRYEGLADFESITDFYGPELIRTNLPLLRRIDGMENVPPALGELHLLHGITPESETSCHYYGVSVRNFRLDSEEVDQFELESDMHIRGQDKAAIEAVEARLDASAALQRELLAKSDTPAAKVRALIKQMLEAEQ